MIKLVKSNEWVVKKINKIDAKKFTLKHHFLKTFPQICWSYGLYHQEELRAVAVFCSPSSPNIQDIFKQTIYSNELLQLSRLVLPKKSIKNEGSFLLSRAIKLIKLERVDVKCLITYCDIDRGNLGTVFKASNWIEFGMSSTGGPQAYKIGSKTIHSRHHKILNLENIKKIKRTKKIRYVYYYANYATKTELDRLVLLTA